MEARLNEIERRLAVAECRGRAMFLIGLVALAGALTLVAARPAVTQSAGSTVQAPFRVTDPRGRTILEVSIAGSESALRMFDSRGRGQVRLFTGSQGGGLRTYDARGTLITASGPGPDPQSGDNAVFVFSPASGYSCWLNTSPSGSVTIRRGNEIYGQLP